MPAGSDGHVTNINRGPWTRLSANGPLAATVPERKRRAVSSSSSYKKKLQTTQETLFPRRAAQKSRSFTSGGGENAPRGRARNPVTSTLGGEINKVDEAERWREMCGKQQISKSSRHSGDYVASN